MDVTKPAEIAYLRQCAEGFLAETATQRQLREIATLLLDPTATPSAAAGKGKKKGKGKANGKGKRDDDEEQAAPAPVVAKEKLSDYREDSKVSVYSKSADRWFDGIVTRVNKESKLIAVEYLNTVTNMKTAKSMEFGSRDVQLVDKHKQEARRLKLLEPEPEPEPERDDDDDDDEWRGRRVGMLEDDDRSSSVPAGPALPSEAEISKHQLEGKVCMYVISYSDSATGLPVFIRRRYSDFETLRNDVASCGGGGGTGAQVISIVEEEGDRMSGATASKWPPKAWRQSAAVIESRKEGLNAWFNTLLGVNTQHTQFSRDLSPLLRAFLELKDRDAVHTRQQAQIMVVVACDCEVAPEDQADERWHCQGAGSSGDGDTGPPVVRSEVSTDSRSLGWLCPGMCVQVLEEAEYEEHTRIRITWKGEASRGRDAMWVTKLTANGRLLLADLDQRDWVNAEQAADAHWANVLSSSTDGLLPMNSLSSAHRFKPSPKAVGGGGAVEGTPTPSQPTQDDTLFKKDELLDGPVVGVEWTTDSSSTLPPLDWEVQWGYRFMGSWLTARSMHNETMLDGPTEVVVMGSGKQGIGNKMKWQAQVAVQRLADKTDSNAADERYKVRVRALGVTGWGEWSAASSTLIPKVFLPPNPLGDR
jgi:hypothetical protein